jgi:Zn-dependent peptidase ImmA (M78 family)
VRRPDDSTLTPQQYARVRKEAERALRETQAMGVFPTPIDRVMAAANVREETTELNASFLSKMRDVAGAALKRALSKVVGLFHASTGIVFIDHTLHRIKQRFVRLHEAGHGFLPWQRPMYVVVEDCEKSLDPEAADLFDREANVFASEVLFQLDTFQEMAQAKPFDIFVPVRLAPKFDASIYASVRQYVSKSPRVCAVVVLNMPELTPDFGFRATLRRAVQSPSFTTMFGAYSWADSYTPDDQIGSMVPIGGRRASGKRELVLIDSNDARHECIAEAFTQTHQVFVLILVSKPLATIVPANAPWQDNG